MTSSSPGNAGERLQLSGTRSPLFKTHFLPPGSGETDSNSNPGFSARFRTSLPISRPFETGSCAKLSLDRRIRTRMLRNRKKGTFILGRLPPKPMSKRNSRADSSPTGTNSDRSPHAGRLPCSFQLRFRPETCPPSFSRAGGARTHDQGIMSPLL